MKRRMQLKTSNTLVTGGAGFIGSHLVDSLMKKKMNAVVLDDLSSGNLNNIKGWFSDKNFMFIKGDLKNIADARKAVRDIELVFHMAANPEVRVGETDPRIHFKENLVATFNLLEAMRKSESAKTLILASTSTIYGEASVTPTPEEYGPLIPISLYGASKLGCEALACSYVYTFSIRTLILRFANVVGSRSTHGVIADFVRKLRANPHRLEILGDGTQKKSYLYIDDCVSATIHLTAKFLNNDKMVDIYNVGAHDQIGVAEIAKIVTGQMKLRKVEYAFTGGVDGGRGWRGDVKNMQLSVKKLLDAEWNPHHSSSQAIRLATKALLENTFHRKHVGN